MFFKGSRNDSLGLHTVLCKVNLLKYSIQTSVQLLRHLSESHINVCL